MPSQCREIPGCKGVYAYVFRIAEDLEVSVGSLGPKRFPAGVYAYIGSGKGPGGIRARICRHATASKKKRWHIDYITPEAESIGAIYSCSEACSETGIALECRGALTPWVKGFGSSDDRTAETHLYKCPGMDECIRALMACFAGRGCIPAYRLLSPIETSS